MLHADDPSGDINKHLLKAARFAAREKLGILPEADREALRNWLQEDPRHQAWLDTFLSRQDLDALLAEYEGVQSTAGSALKAFHHRQEAASPTPVHRISQIRRWWAAAAAVLLIAAGAYLWSIHKEDIHNVTAVKITDISPGSQGAVLTLADGSEVLLDTLQNGVVALQGDATAKVKNGVLTYEGSTDQLVYNTVSTPNGRQYQVMLPDGTKVWLNSASSIRYPMTFNGNSREVSITGEAYFEVMKWHSSGSADKVPFIVKTQGQEITVLGTQFNVFAYKDEEETKTTLVAGKVNIMEAASGTSMRLKPNQQATLRQGKLSVKEVDVAPFVEWKDGLFSFHETGLRDAMNQLSRWYDLTVTYEGQVPDTYFFG